MKSELFDTVSQVLKGPCGVTSPVSVQSRLVEDLELDSVGLLCLAVGLENRYRVKLEENPEEPPDTVADVVDLLKKALEKQNVEP